MPVRVHLTGESDALVLVCCSQSENLLLDFLALVGFALEICETATFFVEGGGAFAEFSVGLVDEGLFCL